MSKYLYEWVLYRVSMLVLSVCIALSVCCGLKQQYVVKLS